MRLSPFFVLLCGLFCTLLVLSPLSADAQPKTHYEPTNDFQADWVTLDELPSPIPSNLWCIFRKSFELENVPSKALCRISCDSKYWLYVNGERLVFEGQLKRGPTPKDTYYDLVDIAPALKKGKNSVSVLMWYFGKDGFSHKNSGVPGFLFDASTNGPEGLKLLSDGSWKGFLYTHLGSLPEKDPQTGKRAGNWREMRIGPFERHTADPQPNFRLPESNIRYDARFEFAEDWTATAFDDSQWKNVKVIGKPPIGPWNALYERPIPQWKDFGLKNYENAAALPKVSSGESIRCKLPYNAQVTPYLKIDAPEGFVIDIRTENYHGGSEYNVRTEYVTKKGVQEFETFGWMNGHEVIYTMPEGVKILELKYRETGFDTEFAGSFQCDNPFMNRLWEKSRRTLYITMRDTYFDCPDRERAQWWGDAVNELGEAFYAMDLKSALLARKGMYELMRWQRDDHIIYSPVPAGNWDRELPMQMLASIGPYSFGTWADYTGDTTVMCDLYPQFVKYMSVWKFGDDNLILHRTGAWDWGDWGENIDLRVMANCWYYLALQQQSQIATLLGKEADLKDIAAQRKRIEENFDRVFWTGTEYRDPAYKGETDDRSNAMAVIAGLAKKENYPKLREVLRREKHASPYMEKYVLESLYKMGYENDALARMQERFSKMVDSEEYSTLWEGWGIGAEGYGGGTINHAWSGGGLTLLAQYAAGLSPDSLSGFKSFQVRPQMGSLKWINLSTHTQYGDIKIDLENSERSLKLTLHVPEGTTAVVRIPGDYAKDAASLTVEGATKTWTETHGDYHAPFAPGTWKIETKK